MTWNEIFILENLSTTTKIESLPHLDLGKPNSKSIEISIEGSLGIGSGMYEPWGCTRDFAYLHVEVFFQNC